MTDRQTSRRPTGSSPERGDSSAIARGLKRRVSSPSWLARAAGVGLSSVSIGFVALFVIVLESAGQLALITRPLPMRLALALPYLIASLTLATTAGAVLAWRYRYWSLSARIHQTLLALLGVAFSWQLAVLGFISL